MNGAQAARLPDGRLHLHHGPIDLILGVWGPAEAVTRGEDRAVARFAPLLGDLAAELPALRAASAPLSGPVARAMAAAVAPFRPAFVTPMAAVAGAVAEAVLAALAVPGVRRAYVNNGGDIALHLEPGERLVCAVAAAGGAPGRIAIRSEDPVRGVATSGWRGRSWSLGIADAVTALAPTAAMADAAATMIANAVDLPGHPAVRRRPARELQADSDLRDLPVTVEVGPLSRAEVARALDRGLAAARAFRARGLIAGAALFLADELRIEGPVALMEPVHA